MKIILVSADDGTPSFGAYAIRNALDRHGYQNEVFSYFNHLSSEQIYTFTDRNINKGDVVGISTTFANDQKSIENFNLLYDLCSAKQITVVIGGINYNTVLKNDVDFRGDYAEDTFITWLNNKFGKIKRLPFSIETTDFEWKAKDSFSEGLCLPLELSRHCIFNCKFCSFPDRGKRGQNRSNYYVRQELDSANKLFGTKHFQILCSTFNESSSKLFNFFNAIEGTDYQFSAYIRLDLLIKQKEFWPLFRKHITHMMFGIETFNHKSGQAIGKGTEPTKVKQWLKEIRNYFDINTLNSGFILGLPFSTEKEGQETLEYLLGAQVLDSWRFFPLSIGDRGSRINRSDFSDSIENYGYTRQSTNRFKNSWVRNDGLTYEHCIDQAMELDSESSRIPSGYTAIFLQRRYSLEQMKNLNITGTPYNGYKIHPKIEEAFKEAAKDYITRKYV